LDKLEIISLLFPSNQSEKFVILSFLIILPLVTLSGFQVNYLRFYIDSHLIDVALIPARLFDWLEFAIQII